MKSLCGQGEAILGGQPCELQLVLLSTPSTLSPGVACPAGWGWGAGPPRHINNQCAPRFRPSWQSRSSALAGHLQPSRPATDQQHARKRCPSAAKSQTTNAASPQEDRTVGREDGRTEGRPPGHQLTPSSVDRQPDQPASASLLSSPGSHTNMAPVCIGSLAVARQPWEDMCECSGCVQQSVIRRKIPGPERHTLPSGDV